MVVVVWNCHFGPQWCLSSDVRGKWQLLVLSKVKYFIVLVAIRNNVCIWQVFVVVMVKSQLLHSCRFLMRWNNLWVFFILNSIKCWLGGLCGDCNTWNHSNSVQTDHCVTFTELVCKEEADHCVCIVTTWQTGACVFACPVDDKSKWSLFCSSDMHFGKCQRSRQI